MTAAWLHTGIVSSGEVRALLGFHSQAAARGLQTQCPIKPISVILWHPELLVRYYKTVEIQ